MSSVPSRKLTVLVLAAAFAGQAGMTVPAALLDHANGSPVEFAMAMANASVPSGLEIAESDDVLPARFPVLPSSSGRVPAAEVVRVFNAHNPRYRASVMSGGVIVVRPLDGTLPFLDQPSTLEPAVTVTGVMAAARRVFSALSPGLAGPIVGSGRPRFAAFAADVPIVLDGGGGRRVIETLNQIVAQAPSRTWVVTTRKQPNGVRAISFGFIEANGDRLRQGIR